MHKILIFLLILLKGGFDECLGVPTNNHQDEVECCYFYTEEEQQVQIIEEGSSALYLRLKLIEEARESIDVEYFKYAPDRSGRVFNQALIQKAREGIKVRVLVDFYGGYKQSGFDEFYFHFLENAGVDIRFYNLASVFKPRKLLFRNHRKSLIIDDRKALLGGRNQLDRFFELDSDVARFDREVFVTGSVVERIGAAFDCFWNSEHSKTPKCRVCSKLENHSLQTSSKRKKHLQFQTSKYHKKITKKKEFFTETQRDRDLAQQTKKLGKAIMDRTPVFIVRSTEYISDSPNFDHRGRVMRHMYSLLPEAKENIVIETLSFIPMRKQEKIFMHLLRSGVEINVLTNSLYAAPNRAPTRIGYHRSLELVAEGLNYYAYKGDILKQRELIDENALNARWSIHTKSTVIDGSHTLIGSYNFDPRAINFDAEQMIVFYNNTKLATYIERQFHLKTSGAGQIKKRGRFIDGTSVNFNLTLTQKIQVALKNVMMRPFISIL